MELEEQSPDCTLKVILLGDSSVGKTCLVMQYLNSSFSATPQATIGVGYGSKTLSIDGRVVRLQIWDTVCDMKAGQEAFRSITKSFYRGADAACIVYSIASRESFDSLEGWMVELKAQSDAGMLTFLVGNMSDLEGRREVSLIEGKELAKKMGICEFVETSAKTGDNVAMMFNTMAQKSYTASIAKQPSISVHSTCCSLVAPAPVPKTKKSNCCN